MQFSELTFEKVVLEVRYDSAYVFWDNSGKTMRQITGKHPKLEMVNAQLSSVQSAWWDEGMTFNFNNVKADLTQDYPTSLETFKAVSASICDGLGEFLEVKSYTRGGYSISLFLPIQVKGGGARFLLEIESGFRTSRPAEVVRRGQDRGGNGNASVRRRGPRLFG